MALNPSTPLMQVVGWNYSIINGMLNVMLRDECPTGLHDAWPYFGGGIERGC